MTQSGHLEHPFGMLRGMAMNPAGLEVDYRDTRCPADVNAPTQPITRAIKADAFESPGLRALAADSEGFCSAYIFCRSR